MRRGLRDTDGYRAGSDVGASPNPRPGIGANRARLKIAGFILKKLFRSNSAQELGCANEQGGRQQGMAKTHTKTTNDEVSFLGAVAIGVGGMVGGGIFAVLGLAAVLAGGATPIAFAIAGVVALLTAYSYSKLSVAYPDNGGTIIFIDKAFGIGWFTGSVNNLLWMGYLVTLALYAVAFGNYAATFLPANWDNSVANHVLISAGILLPSRSIFGCLGRQPRRNLHRCV
ncbi:MAG: amino acid permease [bacterium]